MDMFTTDKTGDEWTSFLAWERATHDTIDFKKAYVDLVGDARAGLVLSQLIYWYLPSKNGENRLRVVKYDPDTGKDERWIVVSRYAWWDQTRLSPKQVDRALDILESAGLIKRAVHRFDGQPTTHIRVITQVFLPRLHEVINNPPKNPYAPNRETRSSPKVKNEAALWGNSLTKTTDREYRRESSYIQTEDSFFPPMAGTKEGTTGFAGDSVDKNPSLADNPECFAGQKENGHWDPTFQPEVPTLEGPSDFQSVGESDPPTTNSAAKRNLMNRHRRSRGTKPASCPSSSARDPHELPKIIEYTPHRADLLVWLKNQGVYFTDEFARRLTDPMANGKSPIQVFDEDIRYARWMIEQQLPYWKENGGKDMDALYKLITRLEGCKGFAAYGELGITEIRFLDYGSREKYSGGYTNPDIRVVEVCEDGSFEASSYNADNDTPQKALDNYQAQFGYRMPERIDWDVQPAADTQYAW